LHGDEEAGPMRSDSSVMTSASCYELPASMDAIIVDAEDSHPLAWFAGENNLADLFLCLRYSFPGRGA